MAVPRFEDLLGPLLEAVADGSGHRSSEVADAVAARMDLSDGDLREVLPSGQTRFANRIGWAKTYLVHAGLLNGATRGLLQITDAGRAILKTRGAAIDVALLRTLPQFASWDQRTRVRASGGKAPPLPDVSDATPEEQVSAIVDSMNRTLVDDLLDRLKRASPAFFERAVLDVLVAMGYGGSRSDAARAVGRSGDGGIDGTINEDRLGLDIVYIQAKRWEGSVSRPEVQKFAGSLDGRRARRGVFLTTGSFTKDARDYVNAIEKRIVLVDGEMLTRLMMDYSVGVLEGPPLAIKKVDLDYFETE